MKKTILITGSNKGIGFEIARQLAKLGHHVILSARNEIRLKQAVEKLKAELLDVDDLLMDVSDEQSIRRAADEFAKREIRLDVLINNAAIMLKNDRSVIQESDVLLQTLTTNSIGS